MRLWPSKQVDREVEGGVRGGVEVQRFNGGKKENRMISQHRGKGKTTLWG